MRRVLKTAPLVAFFAAAASANDAPPPAPLPPPVATGWIDEQSIARPDFQKSLEQRAAEQITQDLAQTAQDAAASELLQPERFTINPSWTTDEVYEVITQNPEAFEQLLLRSLAQSDVQALKTLLPAYERYPAKDQSAVDWGNAILLLDKGEKKQAIALFRKVNAALPDIRLLRLQMAAALYQNKQTRAAKDELQKLLRENISDSERQRIQGYLNAINRADKWTYSFDASFVYSDNIEDVAKVGARTQQGWTSSTPPESGTGMRYYLGANKRWSFDNAFFTSFSAGLGGVYYWDNEKFNDLYATTSVGVGYQAQKGEVEFAPNIVKTWYAGGTSRPDGDDSLKSYTQSVGARLSGHYWVLPRLMYQGSASYSDAEYEAPYTHNDNKFYSLYNGLMYAPNGKSYYTLGWTASKKDMTNNNPANSYDQSTVRLSWQNTWKKGIVTNTAYSIGSRQYEGVAFGDFVPRHNREHELAFSIWKRDITLFGLTPKLHFKAKKITSNTESEQRSDVGANVSLSRTF